MVPGGAPRLKAASSSARSMPSMTLCRVSTMNGRLTAMMPMITAFSVNMISSGLSIRPSPIRVALRKPLLPNTVIQPAARTALPTNSGRMIDMISRCFRRLCVRATT